MTTDDHSPQQFWDNRYASDDYLFGKEPNRFLVSQRALFSPHQRVLAAGDGEGRNGVWLAQQGLNVLAVDHSAVALAKAKALATQSGVALETEQADLSTWSWGDQRFDVIVAIFIQFATPSQRVVLHRAMQRALTPGGLIVLQGYTPKQLEYRTGGPPELEKLYTAEQLAQDFADMDILVLREHEDVLSEGSAHSGMSALVDLVARKKN